MKPIGYVVRDGAGVVNRSEILADGSVTPIAAGAGQEVSLNLRQSDVQGYQRLGSNLQITLSDGRVVMLEDFFGGAGENARLFISADGYINEVDLVEGADGAVYATYGVTEQWGKWSPSDQLIFLEGTDVAHVAAAGDDEVSMLGAGLLGGLGGGAGLLGAGAAVVGAGVIGGVGGGGGAGAGGAGTRIPPTVDQENTLTIGGDDVSEEDQTILISGTAEPGSEVVVTIGDEEIATASNEDGVWEVIFEGEDFPEDGTYDVVVVVTEDDDTITSLEGPSVVIDLTGPEVTFVDGTKSVDDMTNAVDHEDGVEIAGTGEAGASIEVTVDGTIHVTTVDEDGNWGVVFSPSELPGGEYETEVTVVSTDSFGNSTTVTDMVLIDTLASVSIDSGQAGGDDLINAAEQAAGVTLTGTAEAGSSVVVTMNGASHTATAGADGTWSVDFASSEIPTGEQDVTVTAVATDIYGNSETTTSTLAIDTINEVTFDASAVGGDGMVNAAERADGVTLTGTTQPGSSVTVEMNGVSHTATVDASGNWSVDLAAGEIPEGETNATVNVSSVDAAGNVATTSGNVVIDTITDVTIDSGQAGGDDLINGAEQAAGVTLTGTAQVGSSVVVTMNGASHTTTAGADGTWSVDFASSEIPTGEQNATVTAVATDAMGNSETTTSTLEIDTINQVTFNQTGIETDGIVNAVERADGVTLTGTTQPGSSVTVEMNGVSHAATVDASGNWSVDFAAGEIPEGESNAAVNVSSVDAAGNVATTSGNVEIDTLVRNFNLTGTPGGADGVINAAESVGGATLSGTVEPGSSVMVQMGNVSHAAVVDSAGNWTANFAAADIPQGNHALPITATATDAAGNTSVVSGNVNVDTVVENLGFSTAPIEGDDVINAVERADGVPVNGTVEPGSTVQVTMGGVTQTASVDANGNWSANFAASSIPLGEYDTEVRVDVIDAAGNPDSISQTVRVDTLVNALSNSASAVEGDNVVNASEAQDGFVLTGQVEPGSAVMVDFGGSSVAAVVDGAGNWSANIPASAIASGEYTATATIHATDAAGNTDSITRDIAVDTVVPDGPDVASYTRDHTGIRAISIDTTDDSVSISQVNGDGSITDLQATGVDIPVLGETTFGFAPTIPDGSHLVVSSNDAAGNLSSTYLVLDEFSTSMVNMANPNLGALQIEAIDLQFAEDSQLTITEAQLVALSDNSDTVTVTGGSDDTVTIAGAIKTDETVDVNGQMHDVYTLGDTGTLIIDDDINVVI
ncbi:Ig-like domain-containing protein [Rhodobacteraceae bacterium LMO-12]|nr:Ig-like domain-containing protein [Rhodobacteraceae bacterium LMO-JJ12]